MPNRGNENHLTGPANGGRSSDSRQGETIDGATGLPEGTPPQRNRRIDLSSLRDVRLELAALYRKIDSGEVASIDGSRRAYVLKTIADVIALADLEKRIEELEERRGLPDHSGLRQAAH